MPLAIDKLMPNKWLNDNEEGGKNQYEEQFLQRLMTSSGKNYKYTFDKLVRPEAGRKLIDNIQRIYDADFSVIVYNFLDILSHARTETDIIRELTEDEASFRSLTRSWFEHSDLLTLLRLLSERGHTVIITSDHGTIRIDNPVKVTGDRETSANLRYKTGRNLATTPARYMKSPARKTSSCRRSTCRRVTSSPTTPISWSTTTTPTVTYGTTAILTSTGESRWKRCSFPTSY